MLLVRSALRPLALSLVLPLGACQIHLGEDHIEVDGVRLREHHEEVLTLESWPEAGLTIDANRGDVRIEPGEGPTTITVIVHERTLGEAHAHVEESGRLVARAPGGAPCAIGDVVVRTAGEARGLRASTGMGDVSVCGVRVAGRLALETGMGDVLAHGVGEPEEVTLDTGMGDVEAKHLRCARLAAETGMGSVLVEEAEAGEAVLSSGMGDVEIVRSSGASVRAETGMGNVDLRESSFTARTLDSGLGKVRQR